MINLDSKQKLSFSSKNKLIAVLEKHTPIHYKIREWDLTQLASILTVDSLADDEARKKAVYRSKRNTNAIIGGIVGGLLDASSGDDSIIDGVLLGAAFGVFATSSPEKPKAQVGLVFLDGSHISVEIDKDDYTQIQTVAAVNTVDSSREVLPAFTDRNLSPEEVTSVLSLRSGGAFTQSILTLVVTLIMVVFAPAMIKFLDSGTLNSNEHSPLMFASFLMELITNNYFVYGLSSLIGLVIIGQIWKHLLSDPDLERFLLSGEEREFYSNQVLKSATI